MKRITILWFIVCGVLFKSLPLSAATVQQRSKVSGAFRTPAKTIVTPSPSAAQPSQPSNEMSGDVDTPDTPSSEAPPAPTPPANPEPVVIPQNPIIKGNVYIINALPYPLSTTYKLRAKVESGQKGPSIIQPGQVAKALSYTVVSNLKPKQWFDFNITINGTITQTQQSFSTALIQRIINDGEATNYEYSMAGVNPKFTNDWTKPSKELSNKITLGQTDIFFDVISHETPAATDIYYCISPKSISLASDTTQAIIGKDFVNVSQLPSRIWQDMFTVSSSALKSLDAWPTPRPELRYDQTAFLGTNLSFANSQAGFTYTTQLWSIQQQLKNGVRVLGLSIYPDGAGTDKLCLGDCSTSQYLRSSPAHHSALEIFNVIKQFLDANPKEILTIILNSKIGADSIFSILNQVKLTPFLLTKAQWDPVNRGNLWPRIGWMQDYKVRLVIFDQSNPNPNSYGYPARQYVTQNTPYTLDMTQAAKQLPPTVKPQPRLFLCNYYGVLSAPTPAQNSPEQLKKLLDAIRKSGYLLPNQTPNFIMLDHVEMGNPMALINELNKAAKTE